jgi:WD40 repeat protein
MMSLATDGQSALICDAKGQARKVALTDGALIESLRDAGFCAFFATGDILAVGTDKHFRQLAGKRVWTRESVIGNPDDPTILEDRVNALAFSPDAKLIATGGGTPSRSGELKLWRTDGTLVRAIARAHADTINGVAFSPDGDFIATAASDRLASIWSSADGARLASFEGHAGHVLSIAWRADGLVVATGGADKTVRTWDFLTRKQIKATTNFGGEICAVRFVGTGDLILAAAGDRTIRLGDQTLPDSGAAYPFCAASDRAGEVVGAGWDDGKVRFWKVADRKLMRTLDDPAAVGTRTAAAP